jgi:hypothetical protein
MTTKAKKATTKKEANINTLFKTSEAEHYRWTRERALELSIDLFKQPFFVKEANAYAIVSLADTFATFVSEGKDAAFPGAATPVATQD